MAIRFISDEGSKKNDLPWVNEYLSNGGKAGDATLVDSYIDLQDKILILGVDFKACVWKKTQMYRFFIEAVEGYKAGQHDSPAFLIVAEKSGKVAIAIDDEDFGYNWISTDRGNRLAKKNPVVDIATGKASNPFLVLPPTHKARTRTRKDALPDVGTDDVPFN